MYFTELSSHYLYQILAFDRSQNPSYTYSAIVIIVLVLRLVSTTDPTKTIWVAYARGNDHLTGNDGSDIGSKLLFGGPTLRPDEPNRSKQLRSYLTKSRPFTTDLHTYKCQWEKGKITLHVDNVNYGTVLTDQFPEFDESEVMLFDCATIIELNFCFFLG